MQVVLRLPPPPSSRRNRLKKYCCKLSLNSSRSRSLLVFGLLCLITASAVLARDIEWQEDERFGERGRARNEFRTPVDVALLGDGTVVALDAQREALIFFSDQGRYLRTLGGTRGVGTISLRRPTSLAVDADDRIWVVDGGNHRVVVVDINSAAEVFAVGSLGSSRGRFRDPRGIAFDGKNKMYVADTGNRRIQVLSTRDGTVLAEWDHNTGGRRGHLSEPIAVACTGQGKGGVWVLNQGMPVVELFDFDGEWQKTITLAPQVEGDMDLRDVWVEETLYRMFLADAAGRVLVLDRRGDVQTEIRTTRDWKPQGLALSRQLDLYVADGATESLVTFLAR